MNKSKIKVNDTTLRDGEQTARVVIKEMGKKNLKASILTENRTDIEDIEHSLYCSIWLSELGLPL